jgi:hypothetical protein
MDQPRLGEGLQVAGYSKKDLKPFPVTSKVGGSRFPRNALVGSEAMIPRGFSYPARLPFGVVLRLLDVAKQYEFERATRESGKSVKSEQPAGEALHRLG